MNGQTGAPRGPSRRTVVAGTALAPVAGALLPGAPPAAAAPRRDGTARLRSDALDVRVDTAFPRIVAYTDRGTGAVLHGQDTPVSEVLVDGTARTPHVTHRARADRATYTLGFDGGTRITVEIAVRGRQVTWRVTGIADTPALRIGTLEIPGLALLSVRSDQPGATLLAARIALDKATSGDTLVQVTADTPAEAAPTGCAYAVVATDELAAAVETNTVYDKPAGATAWENGRLWRQTLKGEGFVKAQLVPGQWTHRAAGQPPGSTEPLPYATVIVTGDRNGDGRIDWQDAAIALRDIMVMPLGADAQHLRVVPHIAFNFASQATNPFLATLDNVKRIALATDGLGQFTLLKGYQSEGHDSAHPDYGGNYNQRAGGLADLNALVRAGKKWNSDFAVHVNATESYPVAHAFSEELVDKNDKQWDWLDQSYRIDARRDLVSGDIAARFAQLRKETDPALTTLYIDVFRESGWNSDRLQRHLRDQGWQITTEWGHGLERSSLWSHWANETDYGPDTSRGINSQLIRFVRNHHKDVFADKWPTLLGSGRMGNFEGWVGKTDWNAFHTLLWTEALPAKYLQAYPIRTWRAHEITFEGPTRTVVSDAGSAPGGTSTNGPRKITTDGRLVYDDGTYLLPWEPRNATDPGKLYHYNPHGGTTRWALPRGWSAATAVHVYRLTDQGRTQETRVPVRDGKITLTARPGVAYVVHRHRAPAQGDPHWGEGTPLTDPGFHAGTLDAWRTTGPAAVRRSTLGDYELVIGAGAAATVAQHLRRLAPGSYAASVQIEVGATAGERRRAGLEIRTADGVTAANWTDTSTAGNYVAADRKSGTRFQRLFTHFTVPDGGGPVTLTLTAAAGHARVRFDNVRVVPAKAVTKKGTLVYEDFEHVPQGWGPFVKGDAGGSTDPRTHLAQRHARFTQRGWNGKAIDDVLDGGQSLKSRGENTGLVYRTVPHTVRFTPGRRYRVTFRYENEKAGEYAWVTAVDEPAPRELSRSPLPVATQPTTYTYEFTAPASGEAWVGLRKVGDDGTAEFVLDTFEVREVQG
ncbi:endo-alpha-N-acetylgalactosaminidase [Streptomyces sp. 2333.5]|uniref:endo-alpha-N-acetylgalactosaminidase family protein n=1 Tax=unclassified Streptomyces TaxID=2593676 RepID=UPI00089606C3|nr:MULTISPECIES: endo-alpha-N-acetylgalactosaminidase family protein [unclassified Streptomyces]PJJ01348.1 endo-alpha-N-acetylgalactosaminidase [Streptomyces sp. 2333.5]SEC56824.1 endo-alpha-N-acetylgalactosaminidase [Streptomyces sp. 2314.4]SED34442.1 endo-alpha-N-acetylgalactosaminidase [Streptomyces sp. 2112.2]